jgi:hypothetical protein
VAEVDFGWGFCLNGEQKNLASCLILRQRALPPNEAVRPSSSLALHTLQGFECPADWKLHC